MQLRASVLLSIAAAVLVGVNALPAPQLGADTTTAGVGLVPGAAGGLATSVETTPKAVTSASAVNTDTTPVVTSTPKVVVVTTSAAPSTTLVPTTSAVA